MKNEMEYRNQAVVNTKEKDAILASISQVGASLRGSNGIVMTVENYNPASKEITLKTADGRQLVAPRDQFLGRIMTGNIMVGG